MPRTIQNFIDRQFFVSPTEKEDKRCSPEAAISRHIRPGMSLYLLCGAALLNPLIRGFWGTRPDFTIITTGVTLQLHAMVHGGLVKKAITSFAGHTYPSPRPGRVIQKAVGAGRLEIENWNIRTIVQRLLAAALGLDFLPTRSIVGSTMAEDNAEQFKVIDTPFGDGPPIGAVRALTPDIAIASWEPTG
jgi:acyl CoA:acetate/3-ketoacid CoA transferase alpha subunit